MKPIQVKGWGLKDRKGKLLLDNHGIPMFFATKQDARYFINSHKSSLISRLDNYTPARILITYKLAP